MKKVFVIFVSLMAAGILCSLAFAQEAIEKKENVVVYGDYDVLTESRGQISRNVGVAHVVAKCAVQISGTLI